MWAEKRDCYGAERIYTYKEMTIDMTIQVEGLLCLVMVIPY